MLKGNRIYVIVLTCFLLATSVVQAQEETGGFVGLTYGILSLEAYDDLDFELISESGDQLRLFGGYRVNDHFAFEAGWSDTSGIDDSFSGFLPCCGDVTESFDVDIETLTLRAVGIIPFDRISLFGALGYYDASFSGRYSYTDNFESISFNVGDFYDDSGAVVAAGIEFDFENGLRLRGEAEWFDTPSDVDAYAINVGLLYYFGR
ncbi:MAG: porin family protein [Gammaproteobacteria bacterium]|nr:porin family protein [Gammaproteobacteria bacterium]